LIANNVTVNNTYRIEALASATTRVGFKLQLTGSLDVMGRLQANNGGRGSFIVVKAGGTVRIHDGVGVDVSGTASAANGGDFTVDSVGNVTIESQIAANGKPAGDSTNENVGGSVVLKSKGTVTVAHDIVVFGRWWGGGEIVLDADGDVVLTANGRLQAHGESLTADGGSIDIEAGDRVELLGDVTAAAAIGSGGGEGQAGELSIGAGCGGVLLGGTIDMTGGEGGGGDVFVQSKGPVTVSGPIDVSGIKLDGNGGEVAVVGDALVRVTAAGALIGSGDQGGSAPGHGVGGNLDLEGCRVDVADGTVSGGTLSTDGYEGGHVALRSRALPLQPYLFNDYGVRVGERADVIATGAPATSDGTIELAVAQQRSGLCSNNPLKLCTLDVPDCVVGWNVGQCTEANPDTAGRRSQFDPSTISIVAWSNPPSCGLCP
jgi:hypothetical protein